MHLIGRCVYAGAAALAFAGSQASATWSILIVDMRTGEIVIASATCVETIDLRRETPVLITGIGAVTAQSAVDGSGFNRMLIRDRLLQGVPLESILDELAQVDAGHGNRQYGFITAEGDTLTYSGFQNANWAGGITGRIEKGRIGLADDIVYSVQGNILSGPNVVQDAVDAIINTDTDLPGRLMAAMRAAQVGGGDGRCSCSNSDPTGCGSPPPGPFKSAHVGYMLGTRADDIDSVRAAYPITNLAGGMAIADLDHDGFPDVVIGDAAIDEISIFMNSASEGDPLSHMYPRTITAIGASETTAMSTGDFNNDGYDDVAIALASPPTLAVLLGQESGGLGDPILHSLPAPATGMDSGELEGSPGDELAITFGSIGQVRIFSFNNTIYQSESFILDGNPGAVSIAKLVGSEEYFDLAIARRDTNTLWIGRNINGDGYTQAANIPTANDPIKLIATDMDGDGDTELVVLSQAGRRAEVFAADGKGWSQTNSIAINRDGRGIAVGLFNDDQHPDIITTSSSSGRNLQLFENDGQGAFDFGDSTRVGSGSRFVELVDMNNNGNLDLVISNGGLNGLMLIDNPRGSPISNPGRFADGEYFLELNIANQRADDPDPVDQLADQFDTWRAGLAGKVDAVQSVIVGRHRISTNSSTTVTIELRDWQGNLLAITDPGAWSLDDTNGRFAASAPTLIEPGIFELEITPLGSIGQDTLTIRVGDGTDQVRLMPEFGVFVLENIADFTADGVLDFFDISAFLGAYFAGDLDADLTGEGELDFNDVSLFLLAFNS